MDPTENQTDAPQLPNWTQGFMVHLGSMYSGAQTADLSALILAVQKDRYLNAKYDKYWKEIESKGSKTNLRELSSEKQNWGTLAQLVEALDAHVKESMAADPTSKQVAESWASSILYETNRMLLLASILPTVRLVVATCFTLMGGMPTPGTIKKGRTDTNGLNIISTPVNNATGVYAVTGFRKLKLGERSPWAKLSADPYNISLTFRQAKWGLMQARVEADYGDHKERAEVIMALQRTGGIGLHINATRIDTNRPQGFATELSQTKSYEYMGAPSKPFRDNTMEVKTVGDHMRGLEAVQSTMKNILLKVLPEELVKIEQYLHDIT